MENKEVKICTNAIDILSVEDSLEYKILSKQNILDGLKNESTSYLVCYVDNSSVGYLAFSNCVDHIDIISIATKPEFRRKGIAKTLLEYLNTINTKRLKMFLEVRVSNKPAINLYNSLNFKYISTRANYYSNPNEDALIYLKE